MNDTTQQIQNTTTNYYERKVKVGENYTIEWDFVGETNGTGIQ